MQALMEGVSGACSATCILLWLLSNVSAGGALFVVYKFHAKLLFFVVSSLRVLSHFSSAPMRLCRAEDDIITVTSSTQSTSLIISNLVPLHKPIP
jgi:hypothetical protein